MKKFPVNLRLLLSITLLLLLACTFPGLSSITSNKGETTTTTLDENGGTVQASDGVSLIVPAGALSEAVDVEINVGGDVPDLQNDDEIIPAGNAVEVEIPEGTDINGVVELLIPFERDPNYGDDQYGVMRWDGERWWYAGGLVDQDEDVIRISVNQFSIYLPAKLRNKLRPVSFVNEGPYDAVAKPWTFVPLDPNTPFYPLNLAVASFAPGGPGLWPNPARFLGLPLGYYTFCIEWDEGKDEDEDGYTDFYHYILEPPNPDYPMLLDEDDPLENTFAREVRFSTDVVNPLEGKCTIAAPSQWTIRLVPGNPLGFGTPPRIVAYGNASVSPPPASVTITGSNNYWEDPNGQVIALMNGGDWIEAACSDTGITAVGVRIVGDQNDGWMQVLVDGQEVWRGSGYGDLDSAEGMFQYYIEVSGLDPGRHTIKVVSMGIAGLGGGMHVAVHYFGFSTSPVAN